MSKYKLARYFFENLNVSGSRHWHTNFEIDIAKLSNAAMQETLLSNSLPRVFEYFFDTALVPVNELKWVGQGLGIGEELKRGYSALFGRFFARDFLNSEVKPQCLLPIDRYHLKILEDFFIFLTPKLQVDGKRSPSLPDWVGYADNEIIVGEAKGSHNKSCWENVFKKDEHPECLENAIKQVNNINLKILEKVRVPFTGWSIASRWFTQENLKDPWIAVVKSKHGVDREIELELEYFKRVVHIVNLERILSAMGHLWRREYEVWNPSHNAVDFIRNHLLEFNPRYFSFRLGGRKYKGIISVISLGGIEPIINDDDLINYQQLNSELGNVKLVMVTKNYVEMMKLVLISLYDRIFMEKISLDNYIFDDGLSDEFEVIFSDQIVMINEIAVIDLKSIDF